MEDSPPGESGPQTAAAAVRASYQSGIELCESSPQILRQMA